MREKIAKSLYEKASAERDGFIDERKLDARKSWPWDKLSKRNIDYWEEVASQILKELSKEIEKVGYSALDIDPDYATFSEGFAWAKQEILALFCSE